MGSFLLVSSWRLMLPQGWWAAVCPEDGTVGWIPSAFVEPISDALADKLRNSGGNVQIYQEDADRFQGSPDSQLTDPFTVGPDGEQRGYEWMPLVDGEKVSVLLLRVKQDIRLCATPVKGPYYHAIRVRPRYPSELSQRLEPPRTSP